MALVAIGLDASLGTKIGRDGGLFIWIVYFGHILPQVAVSVRRLHDIDTSGWWLLIALTGVGLLVLLIFDCIRGTEGPNRFGPDPLPSETKPGSTGNARPVASDAITEIERLARLKADGTLSDTEFQVMKHRVLSKEV
jgi:hypothetical protein